MNTPSPTPAINFRPGTPDDWEAVAPMAANTGGEGSDISEELWKAWAIDDTAQLIAATLENDQIVGFARLAKLGSAEWWLEGVRIDPQHQSQGVGRVLLKNIIGLFERDAIGLLRFFSSNTNEAMSRLAEELGFRHTMSYAAMQMMAQPVDYHNFKLLQPSNVKMIYTYLRRSPMYRVNHFAEYKCTAYYLTQERLGEYLTDPAIQVLGWRQFDQMRGIAILMPEMEEDDGKILEVAYLDAPDDTTLRDMVGALGGLAAKQDCKKFTWKVPQGVGLDRLILTSGLEKSQDEEMWLYELPLRH